MDTIKVSVASYGDHRALVMRYVDPITGKRISRSTGTHDQRAAERAAAVWQDELNTGRYKPGSKITWAEFRERFEDEHLHTLAPNTQQSYRTAMNHVERLLNPDRPAKLTTAALSTFCLKARRQWVKETTLASWLRCIKSMLRWGVRQGLLHTAPHIAMPKLGGGSHAKHRPITSEELDRMFEAADKVRPKDAGDWKRLLRGLWLSGLRLGEAVKLDWNDGDFVLDATGEYAVFRIKAAGQKSRKDELAPCAPDFVEWILGETPVELRYGPVFPVRDIRFGRPLCPRAVSEGVCKMGRKARVVVGQDGDEKLFAGAHDLRRAFCTRWAKRVMPPVLKRLARHSHINTTMTYYVTLDADEVCRDLWAVHHAENAVGNSFGNTPAKRAVK